MFDFPDIFYFYIIFVRKKKLSQSPRFPVKLKVEYSTAWKVSVFGVILISISRIWFGYAERGKIRTRITPNTDTFYAVFRFFLVGRWQSIFYEKGRWLPPDLVNMLMTLQIVTDTDYKFWNYSRSSYVKKAFFLDKDLFSNLTNFCQNSSKFKCFEKLQDS